MRIPLNCCFRNKPHTFRFLGVVDATEIGGYWCAGRYHHRYMHFGVARSVRKGRQRFMRTFAFFCRVSFGINTFSHADLS